MSLKWPPIWRDSRGCCKPFQWLAPITLSAWRFFALYYYYYSLGYSHKTWIFRISRSSAATISVIRTGHYVVGVIPNIHSCGNSIMNLDLKGHNLPNTQRSSSKLQQILVCLVFANTTVVVETSNEPWCDRFYRATSLGEWLSDTHRITSNRHLGHGWVIKYQTLCRLYVQDTCLWLMRPYTIWYICKRLCDITLLHIFHWFEILSNNVVVHIVNR